MKQRSKQNKKGFTLVELLLYISIVSVIVLAISSFFFLMVQAGIKKQAIDEVNYQGAQLINLLLEKIENAQGINSPSAGASGTSLSLDVVTSADDPTVFDLSSGVMRIKQGTATAVDLTNSFVSVSGLSFDNLTRSGTAGNIKFEFTITHINLEGRNEYDFSQTFYGSTSLRQ